MEESTTIRQSSPAKLCEEGLSGFEISHMLVRYLRIITTNLPSDADLPKLTEEVSDLEEQIKSSLSGFITNSLNTTAAQNALEALIAALTCGCNVPPQNETPETESNQDVVKAVLASLGARSKPRTPLPEKVNGQSCSEATDVVLYGSEKNQNSSATRLVPGLFKNKTTNPAMLLTSVTWKGYGRRPLERAQLNTAASRGQLRRKRSRRK